ncbi:MAG: LPS-assembly protein LptD [Janthinobacterium lividum]
MLAKRTTRRRRSPSAPSPAPLPSSPPSGYFRRHRLALAIAACALGLPLAARAQLSGASAQPQMLNDDGLYLAPEIIHHLLPAGAAPAIFGLAQRESDMAGQELVLSGNAELRRDQSTVKGDTIRYHVDTDTAYAYGHVVLIRSGDVFTGPRAHIQLGSSEGVIEQPHYHFHLTNGRGQGEQATMVDNERTVLKNGTYTTCQCDGKPAWYLRSSTLDTDSGTGMGTARNAVMFFQGLPIFATPWITFPLNGQRQSGLLPATYSYSSTNGLDVSLPYYFNIAPNYDLTVTPRIMSKRGEMLSSTFRYLEPKYSGTLSFSYLPDDAITKTNRYSISFKHTQDLGNGFGFYANFNRVSDSTVTTDLSTDNSLIVSSQLVFQQEAGLTYNKGPWSILAREERWQTFTTATDTPYNREPELDVKYNKYNVGGFDYGAELDATRFTSTFSSQTQGDRLTFNPFVSYPIVRPGWFFTPKIQWHFASYDLTSIGSSSPAGQPKTFSYNVPTFSLDSGLRYERPVHIFGKDYIQTLEPRLYYVYTPYRNQTFAPIFDTAESDFGLAEIFTDNSFVGGDRVADMSRLTAAISTRFIDAASGDERARFVLAQEYYFRTPEVTLIPGESPTDIAHTDIIAGSTFKIGGGFSTEQAVQYNESRNDLARATVGFGWSPAERRVLNVGYRYTRSNTTLDNEPENQLLASAQWPLTRHISGIAQAYYDVKYRRLTAGLIGLSYDADCWSFAIALQKYTNAASTDSAASTGTRALMQLTFKGFANVDNGLSEEFRSAVPGYTATPLTPTPVSEYSDYP